MLITHRTTVPWELATVVVALGRLLVSIPDELLGRLRSRVSKLAGGAPGDQLEVRRPPRARAARPVRWPMKVHLLEREQRVSRPLAEVFEFLARASNLERITPPWLSFGLAGEQASELRAGTRLEYRLRVHGMPLRWVSQIELWQPGRAFVDRQVRGPYRLRRHRHEFATIGQDTIVRDRVHYALPAGRIGELAHALFVRRDLEQIFDFRRQAVSRSLG
jgi:ligand-binding SRPBCC domain-containing protein